MDPLKLLSRSTKLHKKQGAPTKEPSLPSGQEARPQLYASAGDEVKETTSSRKRKRAQQSKQDDMMDSAAPDFFGGASRPIEKSKPQQDDETSQPEDEGADEGADDEETEAHARKLLKQHKLKMTWLNPSATPKGKKKAKRCTLYKKAGTLTRTSHTGVNKVKFSGRIGRKKLKTGSYRLTITATDTAKNKSKSIKLRFKIVK